MLQTLLTRLRELDPRGELTRWRKCSEITNYACAREMATVQVDGDTVRLHLPIAVPELTLQITGTDGRAYGIVTDSGGTMHLFDPNTGEDLSTLSLGKNTEASPAVYGNMIVVASYAKRIWGIRIS